MTESLLLWGVALLGLAALLIFVEVLLPSGGLIAILSAASTIAALVFFFRYDVTWGLMSTLAVLVLLPVVIAFALKVWPHTYFGRRIILGSAEEDEAARQETAKARAAESEALQALVGVRGQALTDLRPVGAVRIEGERVEAIAVGGVVEAGAAVKVVAIEGNRIKVRQAV